MTTKIKMYYITVVFTDGTWDRFFIDACSKKDAKESGVLRANELFSKTFLKKDISVYNY